jgi:hypothetical protein
MIFFQTPNIKLEYDSQLKQVVQTWYNFVPSEDFRKAIKITLEFVINNDVVSIISDTLKQNAVKPEDSEFAAGVMEELFREGVMAMAFIIPEDIFTKMALKKFADIDQKNQHKVEYFQSIAEARIWISSIVLP